MDKPDKLKMHTADLAYENFSKLAKLFPNAVTESLDEKGETIRAIDADILAQEVNAHVVSGAEERYQFTWPDKSKSVLLSNAPITATLRPSTEESVNFYTTENLYIEGDNVDVLKLLRETYLNQVKMIYIDPPYNTGRNYIYKNNFRMYYDKYMENSGQFDYDGNRLVQNTENNGRFHTDWLNNLYPCLKLAKQLLAPDGVLVCAIDENEFASLALLMKEIFGEVNVEHSYVSILHNPRGQQGTNFSYVNEYLIFVYPKDGKKYLADFPKDEVDSRNLRNSGTESDRTDARNCFYPFIVKDGKIIEIGDVPSDIFHPKSANVLRDDGSVEVWPMTDDGDEKKWRYARQSIEGILEKLEAKKGRKTIQIIFNKDFGTMRSVWPGARYDSSEYGTKLLDKLVSGASFTYPKSLWAVHDCIWAATQNDKDALVMDFFSGSATTAHAVMALNASDAGRRKYIMVQLPEDLDSAAAADARIRKSIQQTINFLDSIGKPHTICEIGKERIRRAGLEYQECKIDTGFRVLKLDSSNMKNVYYTPEEYIQTNLDELEDNIKLDRTDLDLLFQIMLELGIPISAKIGQKGKIWHVNNRQLVAYFSKINADIIAEIAKQKPKYAVFRDSSFENDITLANFEQIFNTYSPRTIRRVL